MSAILAQLALIIALANPTPTPTPTPTITIEYPNGHTVTLEGYAVTYETYEDDSLLIMGCMPGGHCDESVPHSTYIFNNQKIQITPNQ